MVSMKFKRVKESMELDGNGKRAGTYSNMERPHEPSGLESLVLRVP